MPEGSSRLPEYDIFVSYAHEDVKRVQLLAAALENEGWRVFWDKTIPAGEDWESFIGLHLDTAPVVIPVWSTASVKSRFVRDEANRANKRGALVPVTIDDVEPMFGFGYINASNLLEWIAGGGGKLPDHLKNSIQRKTSSARTAASVTDDHGNRHPQEVRRRVEEAVSEFASSIRESKGAEPGDSSGRTVATMGTSTEHIAESPQLRATAKSSIQRRLLVASAAVLILLVVAIGLWLVPSRAPTPTPAPTTASEARSVPGPTPSTVTPATPAIPAVPVSPPVTPPEVAVSPPVTPDGTIRSNEALIRSNQAFEVCVGEKREGCPTSATWLPCGTDVSYWAYHTYHDLCRAITTQTLSDLPGNKCGYATVRVKCGR